METLRTQTSEEASPVFGVVGGVAPPRSDGLSAAPHSLHKPRAPLPRPQLTYPTLHLLYDLHICLNHHTFISLCM